jgi:hypothetical protein
VQVRAGALEETPVGPVAGNVAAVEDGSALGQGDAVETGRAAGVVPEGPGDASSAPAVRAACQPPVAARAAHVAISADARRDLLLPPDMGP